MDSCCVPDDEYPLITGRCDQEGPAMFCQTAETAAACNADQTICQQLGYWMF